MDTQTALVLKDFFIQNPGLFVGFILPPVIDILNKDIPEASETQRFLVTFGSCFLIAIVFNFNKILLNNWGEVIGSFGLVFAESQAIYKLYFKDSALRNKLLEKIYGVDETKATVAPSSPNPDLAAG